MLIEMVYKNLGWNIDTLNKLVTYLFPLECRRMVIRTSAKRMKHA